MKNSRVLSKTLAWVVSLSLMAGAAFAAPWYLEDGDIHITADENGQSVTQGSRNESYTAGQENPVITQKTPGKAVSNTITISGGGVADVTIENVNIDARSGSGIDIQGNTTANITANGRNQVMTRNDASASIHVAEGKLNLNTTEGSSVTAGKSGAAMHNGAGIGTNQNEALSGSITLQGKGSVTASAGFDRIPSRGAGIGSGAQGAVTETGEIKTGEGAVTASGSFGAGIGSGATGDMNGTILTGAGAVDAVSGQNGAGIGSGAAGTMGGSITTGEGTVTANSNNDGAGIGSGSGGAVTGSIATGSGRVDAGSGAGGAGIGSGSGGDVTGSIATGSGEVNAESGTKGPSGFPGTVGNGAGIGSGGGGSMEGTIKTADGTVNAKSVSGAGVGSGLYGNVTGKVETGTGSLKAESESGAGIGSGAGGDMAGSVKIGKGGSVETTTAEGNKIGSGSGGSVGKNAVLNVEKGSSLNGRPVRTDSDVLSADLGFPKDRINPKPAVSQNSGKAENAGSYYWILADGKAAAGVQKLADGVLTVTLEEENAELHLTGYGLRQLKAQGVKTLVFKTASSESSLEIAEVLDCDDLVLTHTGKKAELTLDGEASDRIH